MSRYAVKLGVVPTERHRFGNREASGEARERVLNRLRELGVDMVTLDGVTDNGMAYAFHHAEPIVRALKAAEVDAVFFPHCNFGCEEVVAEVARAMGVPVLLWGERDSATRLDWSDITDRQCGLFATGKVLRRYRVPFSYIVNSTLDSTEFTAGLQRFLRAAAVVKAFRRLRIGHIGTRPTPFLTMMHNEGELLEKFGIRVVPVSLADIIADAEALLGSPSQVDLVREFRGRVPLFESDDTGVAKMAALKLAIQRWAEQQGCNAVVIQCWSALKRCFGVGTCFVNSWLIDEGLPVACEADVHGAISMVLLEAASGGETASFLADLTVRHPHNDNAELLWHCGPFPISLWDKVSPAKVTTAGQAFWRIRGGDFTIARFDGDSGDYALFAGEARGVDGPETMGTYVWVEVNDWPAWERKFVTGPYVHHVAGVHGRVADVLAEAAKYLPGVRFDPAP